MKLKVAIQNVVLFVLYLAPSISLVEHFSNERFNLILCSIIQKCYDNCLEWVVKEGYKSIAFPCISTGGNNISSSTASM